MARGARFGEVHAPKACQLLAIQGRNGPAAIHPAAQMGQLHSEHGSLDGIEAAVVAKGGVQVAARHAMHRQLPDGLG